MEKQLRVPSTNDGITGCKRRLLLLVRVAVAVVLVYFIFSLVNWRDAVAAYRTAESRYLLYSFLLLFMNILLRAVKWRIIVQSVKENVSFGESFGSLMLGISLGSFTPAELGEFVGRALHIEGIKKSHIIGLSVLDKLQIFFVTAVFGLISISFIALNNIYTIAAVSVTVCVLFCYLITHTDVLAAALRKLNVLFFKRSFVDRIIDGFVLVSRKDMFVSLFITLLFHLTVVTQMFFLINAFMHISFPDAILATSAMLFVKSILPFSLGDIGIREAGSIYFFSLFDITGAAALNASILLFVINVFFPGAAGMYYMWNQRHLTTDLLKKISRHWNS
jgi:uncharacterized protein (TIRG00374 family)